MSGILLRSRSLFVAWNDPAIQCALIPTGNTHGATTIPEPDGIFVLANEEMARSMKHRTALLFDRLGECTNGTAETFRAAREAFETAWRIFLARRTEADFEAWREHQAWTAEKYRRFDQGERMPAGWRPALARKP